MQLALIYGGRSVEHEISVRSARNIFENIDKRRHQLHLIGISKKGDWFLTESVTSLIEEGDPITLKMSQDKAAFISNEKEILVDLVFPVVHGTDGEDGGIQGLFKVLNIPVVGSDVLGSAVAMDKVVCKQLWEQAGIPVAKFISIDRETLLKTSYNELATELGSPFMLKAGNLGSSVGVNKVSNAEDFEIARTESLNFSHHILAESFVVGRELECAVLGNHELKSTVPGEVILKKDYAFYTYEAKYEDEDAIEISIPAKTDDRTTEKIQSLCIKAFEVAHCKDYGRVDLFLTKDDEIIINEINTIPGFTDVSMFPMLWKNMGLDFSSLIETIIDLCLERQQKSHQLLRSFR